MSNRPLFEDSVVDIALVFDAPTASSNPRSDIGVKFQGTPRAARVVRIMRTSELLDYIKQVFEEDIGEDFYRELVERRSGIPFERTDFEYWVEPVSVETIKRIETLRTIKFKSSSEPIEYSEEEIARFF